MPIKVDDLKRAIELVERCPEEEQRVIARLMIEEIQAEQRWNELFADPRSERVLEAMAAEHCLRIRQAKPRILPGMPLGEVQAHKAIQSAFHRSSEIRATASIGGLP